MKRYLLILAFLLPACSTTQEAEILAIAKPIAQIAIATAASYYGISPSTTQAAELAASQLFGMASVAYQQQPPTTGADVSTIAQAALTKLPSGTALQQAPVLLAAAQMAAASSKTP